MKYAVFSDIHVGYGRDNERFINNCRRFIEWMTTSESYAECDCCLFLGDWFHNRSSHGFETIHASREMVKMIADNMPLFMVTGNHDMFYRNSRKSVSIDLFGNIAGVTIVNEPLMIDSDVGLVPYPLPSDVDSILELGASTLMGHFEFSGFKLNHSSIMQHDGAVLPSFMSDAGVERVFSGHFHKRQRRTVSDVDITYIGSPFGHDFNDVNDFERGYGVYDTNTGEMTFHDWEDGPRFVRVELSRIDGYEPKDGDVVEVVNDTGVTKEEFSLFKEDIERDSELVLRLKEPEGKKTEELAEILDEAEELELVDVIRKSISNMNTVDGLSSELLLELFDVISGDPVVSCLEDEDED